MKKISLFIISILAAILMVSCTTNTEKVKVLVPTGTPSLGVSYALDKEEYIEEEIVSGSDPLIAGFTNAEYDIIVAPVNLGAKFYNTTENFAYVLYETIVWGNYYLASTSEISDFASLEGKTVTVFGKNSTPDVVFRTIVASSGLNVNIEYVDDISTANSYLMSGKAEIIVSAEPSITKLSQNKNIYTLDLQEEWRKLTGNVSLPQAGIFVKKDKAENDSVKKALKSMINSVRLASTNPKSLVKSAVKVDKSLNKIGEETLNNAVGKCNLRVDTNQKEAIEFYFTKVMDLGLGKTVGGKLPDEGFYYQK